MQTVVAIASVLPRQFFVRARHGYAVSGATDQVVVDEVRMQLNHHVVKRDQVFSAERTLTLVRLRRALARR